MARILDIQKKSNDWLANFSANVVKVLQSNSEKMVAFNMSQMLSSKDAEGKPLIHAKTGSPYLSKAYAKRTGKKKPNLRLSGDFQGEMSMTVKDEKEYFINSSNHKTEWLEENYGKIFGVSPQNQPKAQTINDRAIVDDYLKSVWR